MTITLLLYTTRRQAALLCTGPLPPAIRCRQCEQVRDGAVLPHQPYSWAQADGPALLETVFRIDLLSAQRREPYGSTAATGAGGASE